MTATEVLVRKATMRDIPAILDLINSYAAQGIMLPRTEFEMSENIRDFSCAYDAEELAGCGALHFYSPQSAEVRSLAVWPRLKHSGVGRKLVAALEQEARENDLESIFAFTYSPAFFGKVGFSEVERGELPLKVWKDCLRCSKFQQCDEIAVLKPLKPAPSYKMRPNFENSDEVVLLPKRASSDSLVTIDNFPALTLRSRKK